MKILAMKEDTVKTFSAGYERPAAARWMEVLCR